MDDPAAPELSREEAAATLAIGILDILRCISRSKEPAEHTGRNLDLLSEVLGCSGTQYTWDEIVADAVELIAKREIDEAGDPSLTMIAKAGMSYFAETFSADEFARARIQKEKQKFQAAMLLDTGDQNSPEKQILRERMRARAKELAKK